MLRQSLCPVQEMPISQHTELIAKTNSAEPLCSQSILTSKSTVAETGDYTE